MNRRVVAVAVFLLAVSPSLSAKRRAVTPRAPDACAAGTLVPATYANLLDVEGEFVYFIDENNLLARVPRLGGERENLADALDDWLPLSMIVDDSTIYISALALESILFPAPGAILSVPKSGGVVRVFASGVATGFELAVDDQYLYWAAAGLLDISAGELQPGGKIERMKKDGSVRETLAGDLSAPLGIALDGNDVYFGETGLAVGDTTIGLYRVPKSGGAVVTLNDEILVAGIEVAGDTLVVLGGTEDSDIALMTVAKADPSSPTILVEDESLSFTVRIVDRRAYFMVEEEFGELRWVNIDAPGTQTVVRDDLDGDAFALDGCAAIVNTIDGDIVRTLR